MKCEQAGKAHMGVGQCGRLVVNAEGSSPAVWGAGTGAGTLNVITTATSGCTGMGLLDQSVGVECW